MPWYLTIPLVAVGVNVCFRLPMQLYMQRLDNGRRSVQPLLVAWRTRHAMSASQGTLVQRTARVQQLSEKSRKRIYKAWGVSLWKQLIPLSSMLPFAVVSQALRQLSGISSSGTPLADLPPSELGLEGSSALLMEPSLQTGGILWFPDLMVADAYLGLPLICSALLAANVLSRMSVKQWAAALLEHRKNESVAQKLMRGLLRVSIFIPLFPLCFTHLPASVFLYWTANFALQLINVNLVKRLLPPKQSNLNWTPVSPKQISYFTRPRAPVQQKK